MTVSFPASAISGSASVGAGGIAAVQARLAQLASRFPGLAPSGSTLGGSMGGTIGTDVGQPSDPTVGFDAFGDVYQQALRSAGVVPSEGAPGYERYLSDVATGTVPVDPTGADAAAAAAAGSAAGAASPFSTTSAGTAQVDTALTSTGLTGAVLAGTGLTGLSSTGLVAPINAPVYTGGANAYSSVAGLTVYGGTGASVGQIGGYGGMDVPSELRQYQNGELPASVLESIGQGPHRLWGPAAESWKAAVAAAKADGIDLRVTDSYRTYDEQVQLAQEKGLYQNGGLAATPGLSNHGWGLAVDADITDTRVLDWLRQNGYKYGFVEAVKREPWHWEFRPAQA